MPFSNDFLHRILLPLLIIYMTLSLALAFSSLTRSRTSIQHSKHQHYQNQFQTCQSRSSYTSYSSYLYNNKNANNNNDDIKNQNILAQTSWYTAEAFGKIFGSKTSSTATTTISPPNTIIDLSSKPSSINETIARIKLDNDRFYFLSGEVDALSYDPQCYFADPFVGFQGTDRFVENLQNLGSFITKYNVKVIQYDVSDDQLTVDTKLMVKLELNLPWKPILAWPWGVKYLIDPDTFLITSHIESWDVDAFEGVKQVFRKPTLTLNE